MRTLARAAGDAGSELHLEELAGVVARTRVEGPEGFHHGGGLHRATPQPGGDPVEALVSSLAWHLYQREYCAGRRPGPGTPRPPGGLPPTGTGGAGETGGEAGADGDEDLTPALAAAHRGRERWDRGWRVESVDPTGGVVALRGAERRRLPPGSFHPDAPGGAPRPGSLLRILRPPQAGVPQPGFHIVEGAALPDPDESAELVRFYWNVEPRGAARLVARLSGELDRLQVPFRLKVVHRSGSFYRADPAILYVHRRFFQAVAAAADRVHRELDGLLRPATPLFTLPLAPGLALAEDPFTRRSFGLDRCRGVARGLTAAWREGALGEATRLEAVCRVLRERGVDPRRPYLNPGARDVYALPFDWRHE